MRWGVSEAWNRAVGVGRRRGGQDGLLEGRLWCVQRSEPHCLPGTGSAPAHLGGGAAAVPVLGQEPWGTSRQQGCLVGDDHGAASLAFQKAVLLLLRKMPTGFYFMLLFAVANERPKAAVCQPLWSSHPAGREPSRAGGVADRCSSQPVRLLWEGSSPDHSASLVQLLGPPMGPGGPERSGEVWLTCGWPGCCAATS